MQELYKLRKDFAIIGLTGRSGAGCSSIARKLSDTDYINKIKATNPVTRETNDTSVLKRKICFDFLSYDGIWQPFQVIKFTHVLFYQMLYESFLSSKSKMEAIEYFKSIIFPNKTYQNERFTHDVRVVQLIENIINKTSKIFDSYGCLTLSECLRAEDNNTYCDFFDTISPLAIKFYKELRTIDYSKTSLWIQDVACHLRSTGTSKYPKDTSRHNLDNIYIVAETINSLIKCYRAKRNNGRIVIDSLKNSLELTYFKERYAGFYCVATNKIAKEREDYKRKRIRMFSNPNDTQHHLKNNLKIDNTEYRGKQVNEGDFSAPDIENCIQKAEYHIFHSENYKKYKNGLNGEAENDINLDFQLIKFLSLLFHPGLITPSAEERSMQIAYNAKVNSGCISRQVGAVITDKNHSIKAIGWNDVAKNQIPCNLRSIKDLIDGKNEDHYSEFELGETDRYKDNKTFKEKIKSSVSLKLIDQKLQGRNCSFCFKSCHNSFEGKSNQVHTRSLHAEENAMLQITTYGGQGVKNGYLYTTASPCELCSKKAFQLGIEKIYFIDPYPGIATTHILKSGKRESDNPVLSMFRGAVGRGFHKLYEGFMSYKDELNIRSGLHPKESKERLIERLTENKVKQAEIKKILEEE